MKPMNGARPSPATDPTVPGTAPCAEGAGPCLDTDDDIDAAIEAVEQLLRTVTGREPPPCDGAAPAPIPPEHEVGRHVEGQIERLLSLLPTSPRTQPAWAPSISLYELPQELVVSVDLPGVPSSGVEVSLERGFLEVKGERAPRRCHRASVTWNEARVGAFCRRVPLPAGASADGMRAEMTDGVLEVRIPVPAPCGARRVAVQDGAERGGAAS